MLTEAIVKTWKIYKIMYGLLGITIFCHEWGDSAMIFTNDEVVSENHCWITTRVTKSCYSSQTIYHFISYMLFYVLNIPTHWKQSSTVNFTNGPLLPRTVFSDESRDYVYGICQYKVFNINTLFQSKIIWEGNNKQTWVMYKNMNEGKKSIEKCPSTIPNLHTNCHLET